MKKIVWRQGNEKNGILWFLQVGLGLLRTKKHLLCMCGFTIIINITIQIDDENEGRKGSRENNFKTIHIESSISIC